MSQPQPPYFFYSDNCQYSKKLSAYIRQYPELANAIKWVSYETRKFPPEIQSTPAIMYQGQIYKGVEAFGFMQKQVEMFEYQIKMAEEARMQQQQQNKLQQQPNGSRLPTNKSVTSESMRNADNQGQWQGQNQAAQRQQVPEQQLDGYCFGEECGVELSLMQEGSVFNGEDTRNLASRPGEAATLRELDSMANFAPGQGQGQGQGQGGRQNKTDQDLVNRIEQQRNKDIPQQRGMGMGGGMGGGRN
jgi:hypothetical protein